MLLNCQKKSLWGWVMGLTLPFCLSSPTQAQENQAAAPSKPVMLSPAVATMAINGTIPGLLVASAFGSDSKGLLYHPEGTSTQIHGVKQWPILAGGIAGGFAGMGIGMVSASLVPPLTEAAQMSQAFAHLAMPFATAGTLILFQPTGIATGLLSLSASILTIPFSYLLATKKITKEHFYSGNLLALNMVLSAGSLSVALVPQAALIGAKTLEARPIDFSIGSMIVAGAGGLLLGPLSQVYLPNKAQKKVTQMFWGGMLGASVGWAAGLATRNLWGKNDFAGAGTVALVGQTTGLLVGAFWEHEEE